MNHHDDSHISISQMLKFSDPITVLGAGNSEGIECSLPRKAVIDNWKRIAIDR